MDKTLLQQQVLAQLEVDLLQAEQAARVAHEAATHEESIAENKYDTLGLEAAYLASGQARRVESIRQALAVWRQLRPRRFDPTEGVQLGALVCLEDASAHQQLFFIGPEGASMRLSSADRSVQVISARTPLGQALRGRAAGDEVTVQVGAVRQLFEVCWVL